MTCIEYLLALRVEGKRDVIIPRSVTSLTRLYNVRNQCSAAKMAAKKSHFDEVAALALSFLNNVTGGRNMIKIYM